MLRAHYNHKSIRFHQTVTKPVSRWAAREYAEELIGLHTITATQSLDRWNLVGSLAVTYLPRRHHIEEPSPVFGCAGVGAP
jgi:hypothetical protein